MLNTQEFGELQAAFSRLPADAFVRRCEVVARVHADDARAWFLLGAAYHRLKRIEDALRAFENALAITPDHLQALNAKAGLLAALGRRAEARALLEAAIVRFPGDASTLANLGYLLEQEPGEAASALGCYERALEADPANRTALTNRGYLLTLMKRPIEAVINNREFAARYPQDAVAHFNLAESLLAAMRPEQALAACDRAIEIDRGLVRAHFTRALALSELGRLEDAANAFRHVRSVDPGVIDRAAGMFEDNKVMPPPPLDPQTLYFNRGFIHLNACDWERRDQFLRDFEDFVAKALVEGSEIVDYSFAYAMLATDLEPSLHRGVVANLAQHFGSRARLQRSAAYAFESAERPRIRVGYVSPDYREHLNARLTLPIYRLHDRARFEVFCYSLHEDDGSEIRKQVATAADRFVDVSALSSAQIADVIHADGIDILVDLAGITRFSRPDIFAYQAAPLQVSYLGFPGTLGADYMQYRITDRIATPPAQRRYWSERLVYLNHTFYIYDNTEPLAPVTVSRAEYGLPDTGAVFCAFHSFYKIDPQIFAVWMRILDRVPGSVLWMMGADPVARDNLHRECDARGIDPSRLVFAPLESRERYRVRFQLADLYLDTRTFTAMTTACDALWAGLPMITCSGQSFPSRVSASLLTAAGLEDCILADLGAYEDFAVDAVGNPQSLQSLRQRVVANRHTFPLFDTGARVRQLEQAFEGMWQRHKRRQPPEDFDVVT
ncbi:MAG TPA: tetratricopeptide repeat protein [Burkholderiales bacterium]